MLRPATSKENLAARRSWSALPGAYASDVPAADKPIHGFVSVAFDVVHRARQPDSDYFGTLALPPLSLLGLRLPLS